MFGTTYNRSDATSTDQVPGEPSVRMQTPVPSELVLGAALMVAIAVAMTVALWFVAGDERLPQHITTAETRAVLGESVLPTEEFLAELEAEVGPTTTRAEFDAILRDWLDAGTDTAGAEHLAMSMQLGS